MPPDLPEPDFLSPGELVEIGRSARHADPAVQLLIDRAAIRDLILHYAAGVDKRDFARVAACFAPDFSGSFGGEVRKSRDELVGFIRGVAFFHTTMHMMGNPFVEVRGESAHLDCYAMLTHHGQRPDGRKVQLDMSAARYVEELERRDGRWVVVSRGGQPEWSPTGVRGVESDDPAVRWLLDREEIHDLLMQYALGIDLREYARVRACFAPVFRARYGDREFYDGEALVAFVSGVEHFESTTHFMSRPEIEWRGDEALAHTIALVAHRLKPGEGQTRRRPEEWTATARYADRLVRGDCGWRIAERGADTVALPAACAAPPSRDPDVRRLVDRAAVEDAVLRAIRALDSEDDARTTHFPGRSLVSVSGDVAEAETYVYRTWREEGARGDSPWSSGALRFVDTLRRGEDAAHPWQIFRRRVLSNRVKPD